MRWMLPLSLLLPGVALADDSDGDGISDASEAAWGTDPARDDTDDDTVPDGVEWGTTASPPDTDGDGRVDPLDTDDDSDQVLTFYEQKYGSDRLSADSDGDLVDDGQEWDYLAYVVDPASIAEDDPQDSDADGAIDALDPDDDGDGLHTLYEGDIDVDGSGGCYGPCDWPSIVGDGLPNYLDTDSDGDGFPDGTAGSGSCGRWIDDLSADEDSDGDLNAFDYCDCGTGHLEYDGDGLSSKDETDNGLDPSEPDSDHDGVYDGLEVVHAGLNIEGLPDTDADGRPDALDTDDDGDGLDTIDELGEAVNTDGDCFDDLFLDSDLDGTFDYLDSDDDGDGVDTRDEDADRDGDPRGDDTDGDGIPDYLDPLDPTDTDSQPDTDGVADTDADTDSQPDPDVDTDTQDTDAGAPGCGGCAAAPGLPFGWAVVLLLARRR